MNDAMNLEELIHQRLKSLTPISLIVDDESQAHIGHPGAVTGAGHYWLSIVSDQFTGQTKIARHQMIYTKLADLIPERIHALSIHALAPGEEI